LVERVNNQFDSVIIVDSGAVKGTGKSVFSIKLSQEICKITGYEYSFDLIVFNPKSENIVNLVKTLPRGCPIHIDEASKVAYKRDYQKEYQKDLIKFINICRKFGKILILNNPDFWDLDKDLRNLADFRVVIVKRGLAQVLGKSPNPEARDKWNRDANFEKIEDYTKGDITKLEKCRYGIRKTGNHLYDIPFSPLPEDFYNKYVELSKVEEVKSFYETTEARVVWNKILAYMLLNNGNNARTLAKAINTALYNSIYAKTIEHFRITEKAIQDWKNAWEDDMRIDTVFNNNNIVKEG
jgi:hypothetical protein